jgi:hypothetical protein
MRIVARTRPPLRALRSALGESRSKPSTLHLNADNDDTAITVNRLRQLGGGFVAASNRQVRAEPLVSLTGLISLQPFEGVRSASFNAGLF